MWLSRNVNEKVITIVRYAPSKFGINPDAGDNQNQSKETRIHGDFSDELVAINVDDQIIMKTTKVCVMNPNNGETVYGVAMLETGSKHSYITSEKTQKLCMESGPATLVKLNTFGQYSPSEMYTRKTLFKFKSSDGTL